MGFFWFAQDALREPSPPPHADGIVALTGGAERVATALILLRAGRADRLLISGVNDNIVLPMLARSTGIDAEALAGRVTLGHDATDTLGNAAETAAWARSQGMQSLIVVTAGYHMRRALTEIRRDLPGVALYPGARGAARAKAWRAGQAAVAGRGIQQVASRDRRPDETEWLGQRSREVMSNSIRLNGVWGPTAPVGSQGQSP
ncbi:MAG: YdcF family protein [Rhodospirillales bacterium]